MHDNQDIKATKQKVVRAETEREKENRENLKRGCGFPKVPQFLFTKSKNKIKNKIKCCYQGSTSSQLRKIFSVKNRKLKKLKKKSFHFVNSYQTDPFIRVKMYLNTVYFIKIEKLLLKVS